jgi:hypothetical protein
MAITKRPFEDLLQHPSEFPAVVARWKVIRSVAGWLTAVGTATLAAVALLAPFVQVNAATIVCLVLPLIIAIDLKLRADYNIKLIALAAQFRYNAG